MSFPLAELADRVGGLLRGDGRCRIERVASLQSAEAGAISFLANPRYRRFLKGTEASAVILAAQDAADCPIPAIVCENPYLAYAKVASLFAPSEEFSGGRHPNAVVADSAQVDATAWVAAGAVVESGSVVGPRVFIGPGSVVASECVIGDDSRLVARVTLCRGTRVGKRVLLHPGAVIGSDGFGLANDKGIWVKVPQLGRVRIGDDVEIGANTTIDRGALEDTVIHDGVKLDNQIQIAHNVEIGKHTAIAACTGISGSTRVGAYCTLGGGVGLAGHLEIGDNVHFSGQSLVTRSFPQAGYYSGNVPAGPNRDWRKNIARFRHLDEMMRRIKALEKALSALGINAASGEPSDD